MLFDILRLGVTCVDVPIIIACLAYIFTDHAQNNPNLKRIDWVMAIILMFNIFGMWCGS